VHTVNTDGILRSTSTLNVAGHEATASCDAPELNQSRDRASRIGGLVSGRRSDIMCCEQNNNEW
jgi:hypothetical protein